MRLIGKICYTTAAMLSALTLTACGFNGNAKTTATSTQQTAAGSNAVNVSGTLSQAGIYDSEDAAVVVKKDAEAKTIQLQNISTSRRYTLSYDGTTSVYDKNDQPLSMGQIKEGSVVTVRFYKPAKSLAYIKENPDCVNYNNLSNYSLDLNKGTITIAGEVYNISGHIVVSSDGREADMMELNKVDVISVWGYKGMIYGINVEQGHGYLRLVNEDYFVGGWLDVGDKVVRTISEDMLIVVPEGTYSVSVSNKGTSATQEITFNRNEEMAWDLGDVEITVVQKGSIIFTLTPLTATVTVDGKEVNTSNPVTLEYGLHKMQISADGYETVSQYIKVAEPSASISVELTKSEEETSEAAETLNEDNDIDSLNDGDTTTTKKYQSSTDSSTSDDSTTDSSTTDSSTTNSTTTNDSSTTDSSTTNSSTTNSSDTVSSASGKYKVYIDAPEGVEAYLDGNYIGITPVSFEKTAGSYVVSLRKTGYQTRSYTLQIDNEEKDINYTFSELTKLDE